MSGQLWKLQHNTTLMCMQRELQLIAQEQPVDMLLPLQLVSDVDMNHMELLGQ